MGRLAILSHVLPPAPSGQAMMLYRLFKDLDPARYVLISKEDYNSPAFRDMPNRLRGEYVALPAEKRLASPGFAPFRAVVEIINAASILRARTNNLASILRKHNCDRLVACSGEVFDLPAGLRAAKRNGIPFFPYFFDYYAYQWDPPGIRKFAGFWEPRLLRSATKAIVPNEALQTEYRERYGVTAAVVHNPVDRPATPAIETPARPPRASDELVILYTGVVSPAHTDAVRRVLQAISLLAPLKARLHLYTAQSAEELKKIGIEGPLALYGHVPLDESRRLQREADILFLPLAFESYYPELVRTSAPGKLGEYLFARRPVLVHCPPGSFPSVYCRKHDCAAVVDTPDAKQLADAIRSIVNDTSTTQRRVEAALRRAEADFTLEQARAALSAAIGVTI